MELKEIISEVNIIFIDVLDNEEIIIDEHTTANDIDEWDSLTNIEIVVAIEKKFNLRFVSSDIESWKDVGDMCRDIQKRLS